MTDCSKIPTLTDIENSKKGMNDIVQFAGSREDTYVSELDGSTRTTVEGVRKQIGWVDAGEWSTNPEATESNQYFSYAGTNQRFQPLSLPYTVDSTTHPDPNTLVPSELRDISKFADVDYLSEHYIREYDSITELMSDLKVGNSGIVGSTKFTRVSESGVIKDDLEVSGAVWAGDFNLSTLDVDASSNLSKLSDAVSFGGLVMIPDLGGDIPVSDSLIVPSNTKIIWLGSYIRLTQPSSLGALIYSSGYEDPDGTPHFKNNIQYVNPLIDGGDLGWKVGAEFGENGLSASKCSNVSIIGGHIKRFRYGTKSQTSSGGKAINYEFGVENINANGTLIEDCSSALETSASPDGTPGVGLGVNRYAKNVNWTGITVKRCGRIMRIVRAESPGLGRDMILHGSAKAIFAEDCGIEDYETTDDNGTLNGKAAITLDRTTNFDIEVTLKNSPTYGSVDSPIKHLRGYNNSVDLHFTGDCTSIMSHQKVGGQQVGSLEDNFYTVEHIGSAIYAVNREDGDTSFNANVYDIKTDVITDSLVRTPLDGIATFTDKDSKTVIDGDLGSIYNNGNNYDTSVQKKGTKPQIINGDVKFTDGSAGEKVISTSAKFKFRSENQDVFSLESKTAVFSAIPTDPTSLPVGSLYSDNGTVKIKE